MHRLLTATDPKGEVTTNTYDATGNRTAVNDSVNGNASYTANNLNQYTSVGGASYGYDGNGNLNLGANGGLYSYDAQNRLITANSSGITGGNTDLIAYDSKNRVVERTVNGTSTYYIYDGWDLIEERDGSGNVLATYVHGVRQDELLSRTTPAGTIYYHHNALGSVTDLTNASGTVVEKYQYDAYGKPSITDGSGNPLAATAYGNRFLFTGREYLAELGLYDYRNRVYSPDLGRFLQTDPIRFSAGDVNIYRYCGNNPITGSDAMGLCKDGPFLTPDLTTGLQNEQDWANSLSLPGSGGNGSSSGNDSTSENDSASGIENASTVLDTAGLLTVPFSGSSLGDNLSLYSDAFHGNQYVSIAANLGDVAEALGPALAVGAVALDASQQNWGKAALDGGLGAAAYAFPVAGGIAATAVGGYNVGTAIDNIPIGNGNTIGSALTNGVARVVGGH